MIRRLAFTAAAVPLALGAACSSSTSPKPTVAGTWHVTITAFDSGTVSPSSFDVGVVPSGGTFVVQMPRLTWTRTATGKSIVFNGVPTAAVFKDAGTGDTDLSLVESPFGLANAAFCPSISLGGPVNAKRDSIATMAVAVVDTAVVFGGTYYCGEVRWHGTATAVKTGPASAAAAPPAPAPAGTWHVTMGAPFSGAVSPDTFTAMVSGSGNSMSATLPALTWSSTVYDTLPGATAAGDTLSLWAYVKSAPAVHTCAYVYFLGRTFGDSTVGTAIVVDTNLAGVGPICIVKSLAPYTAVK